MLSFIFCNKLPIPPHKQEMCRKFKFFKSSDTFCKDVSNFVYFKTLSDDFVAFDFIGAFYGYHRNKSLVHTVAIIHTQKKLFNKELCA